MIAAVEIRQGVFRPDWSAVATQPAREALAGRLAARAGLLDRWAVRLTESEDLAWRTLLLLYAGHGRAPKPAAIANAAGIGAPAITDLLRTLRSCDLIDLDPRTGDIRLAYPFTQAETGHRVELKGRSLHALCAVDALGVAAMYRTDVAIASPCGGCGATIRVRTAADGKALQSIVPRAAIVWYDFAYDGRAAGLLLSGDRLLLLARTLAAGAAAPGGRAHGHRSDGGGSPRGRVSDLRSGPRRGGREIALRR